MELELNEAMLGIGSREAIGLKRYKDYIMIVRNLRNAYSFINSLIEISTAISENKKDADKYQSALPSAKANFYYALILYTKWFNGKGNRFCLNAEDFFKGQFNGYMKSHEEIMGLGNRYINKCGEDFIGSKDIVTYSEDSSGKVSIQSRWVEMYLPEKRILEELKDCIGIVHDKISRDIIPSYEEELEECIFRKYHK